MQRRRLTRVLAITLSVVAICGYLDQFTRVFDDLEQKAYGLRMQVFAGVNGGQPQSATNQIVLLTISDATFKWAYGEGPPGCAVPRVDDAKVVRELTRDGAKVIAFDLVFDTPQAGDAPMADAVKKSGRVLFACRDVDEPARIVPPQPGFQTAGARWGHTRVLLDPERPAIDRIEPVVAEGGVLTPALCLEAARMARGLPELPPQRVGGVWQVPGLPVPVGADKKFKVRYFGETGKTFTEYPYEQVADGSAVHRQFFQDNHIFQDKIVLIGDTTRINHDIDLTPFGMMPGVEVQANAVATLLQGKFLREASSAMNLLLMAVLASAAALLASVWRLRRAALFLVLLPPAYFAFDLWMFVGQDFFLHLVAPATAMILTALGVLLERGLTEEQEKTRMRGLLQRYVSPQIADHILQHPELLGRAGKQAVGSVLFADIRDFTALSEALPPEELVSRMNEYFQAMTEVVFRHDGTVSSFVGDALLALFGIPVPSPDHAQRAVAAAIEMEGALRELQDRWRARGQKVFDIGIGVNTGEMVVGDVGGRRLMQFTVYGLQVNIASRVESLNRELGTCILITRATYDAVADEIEVRGPQRATVKGVENEIEVFEVLGWRKEKPGSETEPGLEQDGR